MARSKAQGSTSHKGPLWQKYQHLYHGRIVEHNGQAGFAILIPRVEDGSPREFYTLVHDSVSSGKLFSVDELLPLLQDKFETSVLQPEESAEISGRGVVTS